MLAQGSLLEVPCACWTLTEIESQQWCHQRGEYALDGGGTQSESKISHFAPQPSTQANMKPTKKVMIGEELFIRTLKKE